MADLSHLLAYLGRDFERDWGGRVDMVLWCDDHVNSKTVNILIKGAAELLTKITYIIEKSVGTQLAPLIFGARCCIAWGGTGVSILNGNEFVKKNMMFNLLTIFCHE